MKPAIDFDAVIQDWDVLTPKELTSRLMRPDFDKKPLQISDGSAKAIGYPGPRSRLALSKAPLHEPYESVEAAQFVATLQQQGKDHLVISYPTSEKYIAQAHKYGAGGNDHHHQLTRLDVEHMMKKLADTAQAAGMQVSYLPMVKLGERKAVNGPLKSPLKPIRFWTHTQPPKNAAYVLTDDNILAGNTFAGMLSHLQGHGVSSENTPISIGTHMGTPPLGMDDAQLAFIARFRHEKPIQAEKLDIVLRLLGIDGLDALTHNDANKLGLNSKHVALDDGHAFFEIAKDFEKTVVSQLASKNMEHYPAIREPSKSYVAQLSDLGFAPQSPSFRR